MASVYGLTILSPIIDDEKATPSHDLQIRMYLATLPTDEESPFALAPGTHLARLVVMDDVIYVGMPACEEHLKSKYLVFESNLRRRPGSLSARAWRRTFRSSWMRSGAIAWVIRGRGIVAGVYRLHEGLPDRDDVFLCGYQ